MLELALITEQQRQAFEFARMPAGRVALLGLLLLGACCAVAWLYRREARVGAGVRLRTALAALRCLVLVALALVWLEPVVATYSVRTTNATVAVLIDTSASMSIVDGAGAPPAAGPDSGLPPHTRRQKVTALLAADDHAWLKRLAAKNEVALYAFGERTTRVPLSWEGPTESSGSPPLEQWDARGGFENATDIGQALAGVLEEIGHGPVAGIVVVSDGGVNRGASVQDVAAAARRRGTPLYTVGVGSVAEPANVRVAKIAAPVTTPSGDPFELRVEVAGAGLAPVSVPLELWVRPSGDQRPGGRGARPAARGERLVARRRVMLGDPDSSVEVAFEIEAETAGDFIYRARVAVLPGEAVASDNERAVSVIVRDEQVRALLVAGRPSYEYRYLTRLLERDRTVNVSCWLQSADARAVRDGNTVLTELPRAPEDLLGYDVLLLLDPNPAELDSSWAVTARRLVDEFGGGLLYQAGPHYATRLLRDSRLQDLVTTLPVIPDPEADVRPGERGAFRTRAVPPALPERIRAQPILMLEADPAAAREVWAELPGVWWYLPVLREKPLATVLMRHGGRAQGNRYGPAVLMASQPFGSGRTAFLAFDQTWRWRSGGERYFNRFWVRLVRYLAQARRQDASRRGTIVLDRDAVTLGDFVKIEARVLDEDFVPWQESQVAALLELGDGTRRSHTLGAIPGREGWFAARVPFDRPGPAAIRVPLPAGVAGGAAGSRAEALVKRVLVQQPDIEMRSLRLREDRLEALAEQTGGRYTRLNAAGALPDWIESATRVKVTRGSDAPLWDRGPILMVMTALLIVEWALRRRHHLL